MLRDRSLLRDRSFTAKAIRLITYCLPCECSRGSKHINAIDMQSRPAVLMSARLVVASCAEMAAEADIGHYMQHTINSYVIMYICWCYVFIVAFVCYLFRTRSWI